MLEDYVVVELYMAWSEENYASSFISSDVQHVRMFREWLQDKKLEETRQDYETEMLNEYRKQERAKTNQH